ncbi:phosphate-binding protein [Pseudidiomarina salinarum]|uniref:Phosphate-binding protein n=1 Tax=Pseudidiomarina salinarum TaxID=435908 RepID=A0A094JCD6_9GAMM|nr:CYTH domain-containing protein [Pseudidiomarina salinarum]KFZ30236.1 phosphate-binding protein [Pseudidiomarina salinarum]RUO69935.1 CYTH domain-containing protein [Pseudidiomarina salinarum]
MSQETELKLYIEPARREAALRLCQQLAGEQQPAELQLTNRYFDTPDLRLREYDMGLRIRQCGDDREQTVKLAGDVIGGMHRRPEYNAATTSDKPDLTLFDEDIWPDDFPLFDIQRELDEIFRTNFTRQRWRLPSGDGMIELVFDEGIIIADANQRSLCEIELELQGGDLSELYKMARRFITRVDARVGSLSKAARGYLLANKSALEPSTQADFVRQQTQDDVGTGLYRALTYALQYWQHNDACLLEQPTVRAVAGITDGIRLARVVLQQLMMLEVEVSDHIVRLEQMLGHLGWLSRYDGLAELTAEDGAYHRALKQQPKLHEHIMEQQEHAVQMELVLNLVKRDDYQLTLLELGELCNRQPRHEQLMQVPLRAWASQRLREDWQQVAEAFTRERELRPEHYLKQLPLLLGSLQLGYCVGYLFDEEDRERFRAPWLDMVRGIREIMALKLLREAIKDTDDVNTERLLNWQEVQLESLLYALEHSRRSALKQEPYWVI